MYRFFMILLSMAVPIMSHAAQSTAPWLQPEVLKAAVNIGLTDEQLPLFREAITHLAQNQTSATNKLLRQNNIADLERKLTTVTNRQFKKMDREMGAFLTSTQLPRYDIYRNVLREHLTRSTTTRAGSSSASVNDTERTLDQGAVQHH